MMAASDEFKDRAVYHMILSELHRLQAIGFNLRSLADPSTAEGLREHFTREQGLVLGKLSEWRSRRPEVYRLAAEAFKTQSIDL